MILAFIKRKLGITSQCCGAELQVYDANHIICAACKKRYRDGAF